MQKVDINFANTEVAFASKSDAALRKAKWLFSTMANANLVKLGVFFTRLALKVRLPIEGIIRNTIFQQFCGGESIQDCTPTIGRLGEYNIKTILDYSVEGDSDEESYEETTREIIRICEFSRGNDHIPFSVVKVSGVGSNAVMEKVQKGEPLNDQEQEQMKAIRRRVHAMAKAAVDNGLMFMIDAEESWMQDTIDGMTYDLMREFNKEFPYIYNTYQLYRHEALGNIRKALEMARAEDFHLGAKLVRGAYMEKERQRAEEHGYPSPIQPDKPSTDRDFNEALKFCVDNIDQMAVCSGTHNEDSSLFLCQLMSERGIPHNHERIYFAQLLGMSDNISYNLAQAGYNVAKYVPYGPIRQVMPYLFRRAAENTAIAGQGGREYQWVVKEITRRKSTK
jgi:proline dehydrogenase